MITDFVSVLFPRKKKTDCNSFIFSLNIFNLLIVISKMFLTASLNHTNSLLHILHFC